MPVEQLQSVVNHEQLWLGETISKFTMPKPLTDDINKAYDEHLEKLPPFNKQLVGKINQEHLINQRLRWVSKSTHYNIYGKITGIIVVLTNFYIVWFTFLTFYNGQNFKKLIILFLIKFLIDYLYIIIGNSFFKLKISMNDILVSSLIYPFYSILITIMSPFSKFKWKERIFKTSN